MSATKEPSFAVLAITVMNSPLAVGLLTKVKPTPVEHT